jgi:hypothetical protein
VLAPPLDDDDGFLQGIENFTIEAFVAQLCCEIPASQHAAGVALPYDINTSI